LFEGVNAPGQFLYSTFTLLKAARGAPGAHQRDDGRDKEQPNESQHD
jgi:hypothetical protein